jgi:MarR family transcriptional regulator for hemolysin
MPAPLLAPILKSGRQISMHLERELRDLALTAGEAILLSYLKEHTPCPIPMLHRDFGHKRSTLASMLDRLHVRRLLLREVNPEDRRSLMVKLTRTGHTTARRIQEMLDTVESKISDEIEPKDVTGFRNVMNAIERIVGTVDLSKDTA